MDLDRLDALLADAVAEAAGAERASTRMLREAAEQEATFIGSLVDIAERGGSVVVRAGASRSHRGKVRAVGRDFVILQEGDGAPALLALGSIASVREVDVTGHDTAGQRRAPVGASLRTLLARLAAERPLVQVRCAGDDVALLGALRAVGADVVTLRLEADSRATVLVPLHAVTEVVLLER